MQNKTLKPIKPENDDCCGGGCCPCVWDTYFNQLGSWEEQEGVFQPAKTAGRADETVMSEDDTTKWR